MSDRVEALLEAGLQALDAGNYADALDHWNEVLSVDAENSRARRLVEELEALIRDRSSASLTPMSGEFVVVVDDEDEDGFEVEFDAEEGVNTIARGALERMRRLIESHEAEQRRLHEQVAALESELVATQRTLQDRDRELIAARDKAIALEEERNLRSSEQRDLDRVQRQRDRQIAEFEQQVEELRSAHAAQSVELEKATRENDLRKANMESLARDLEGERRARTEWEQRAVNAELQAESLSDELAEMRNALASEQAGSSEMRDELAALKEANAEIAQQMTSLGAKLEDTEARAKRAAEDQAEAESQRERAEREQVAMSERVEAAEAERDRVAAEAREASDERVAAEERFAGERAELETDLAARAADLEAAQQALEAEERRRASVEASLQQARTELGEKAQALEDALAQVAATQAAQSAAAERADAEALVALQAALDDALQNADNERRRAEDLEDQLDARASKLAMAEARALAAEARAAESEARVSAVESVISGESAAYKPDPDRPQMATPQATRAVTGTYESVPDDFGEQGRVTPVGERPAGVVPGGISLQTVGSLRDASGGAAPGEAAASRTLVGRLPAGFDLPDPPVADVDDVPDISAFDDVSDSDLMQIEFDDGPTLGSPADSAMGADEGAAALPATQTSTDPINVQLSDPAGDDLQDFDELDDLETFDDLDDDVFVEATAAYTAAEEEALIEESAGYAATPNDDPVPMEPALEELGERDADTPSETLRIEMRANQSEAAAHIFDGTLPPAERLAWVVDEMPRRTEIDVNSSGIGSQAAFVLQMIDGNISFGDVLDIVGLPAEDTTMLLLDLLERGMITTSSLEG